jgi:hypothetical protein
VSNGPRGAAYERRSRAWLEGQGYGVVRSAGSRGPFDLAAFNEAGAVLVQVKCGSAAPTPAEVEAMLAWPAAPCVRRVVHRWRRRGQTEPDVELVKPCR